MLEVHAAIIQSIPICAFFFKQSSTYAATIDWGQTRFLRICVPGTASAEAEGSSRGSPRLLAARHSINGA